MISRFLTPMVALSLTVAPMARAQDVFGRIRGTVYGVDGQRMPGALMTITGTAFADTTDARGEYTMPLVPAGEYQMCSEATACVTVQVRAGATTIFNMMPSPANEPPIASTFRLSGESLRKTGTDDPRQALAQSPGVVMRGGEIGITPDVGLSVRGGAPGRAAAYVDGTPVRFQTFGVHRLVPGAGSLSEISLTTGLPGVSVPDVAGGVIGYVTRIAPATFRGGLHIESDEPFGNTIGVGYNRLAAELGGPIPALRNLSLMVTGTFQGQSSFYRGVGAQDEPAWVVTGVDTVVQRNAGAGTIFDTIPEYAPTDGLERPYDWTARRTLHGRALYSFGRGASVSVTGMTQMFQERFFPGNFILTPSLYSGHSMVSKLLAFNMGYPLTRRLGLEAHLSFSSDHESAGALTAASELATRDPFLGMAFGALAFRGPDSFPAIDEQYLVRLRNNASPLVPYQNRGDLTNSQPSRTNPYGVTGRWPVRGLNARITQIREDRIASRVRLDWQPAPAHAVEVGADLERADLSYYDASLLNFLELDAFIESPSRAGVFASDRITLGSLVAEVGVRYDRFSAGGQFPRVPGRIFTSPDWTPDTIATDTAYINSMARVFTPGRARGALSPQLRLAYTLSPRVSLRASAGSRSETPRYLDVFSGNNVDAVFTTSARSGSDVKLAHTTTFEVGMRQTWSRALHLDVSAWTKSIANYAPTIVPVFDPFRGTVVNAEVLGVRDAVSTLGVDVRLDVQPFARVAGAVSYSFISSKPFPNTFFTSSVGTHAIHAQAGIVLPAGLDAQVSARLLSGAGWIPQQNLGIGTITPGGLFNAISIDLERLPWTRVVDLRLTETMRIGGRRAELFADVRNLFDFRNVTSLFAESGADTNDVFRGAFITPQLVTLAGEAPGAARQPDGTIDLNQSCVAWSNPTNCFSLRRVEQRFGDGDGMFTDAEQVRTFTAEYELYFGRSRFYMPGRTLRVGLELRF